MTFDPMAETQHMDPEQVAYMRWKRAAKQLQAAHAAFKAADKEHGEALRALGNVVAPPIE